MSNWINPGPYPLTYPTLQPPLLVRPGEVISFASQLPGLVSTGNNPTTPPVDNLTRITVTGSLTTDAGGFQNGSVTFLPVLVSSTGHYIYAGAALTAGVSGGSFSIPLPATDDPMTATPGFTYLVTLPDGESFRIVVPVNSPGGTLDLASATRVVSSRGALSVRDYGALGDGSTVDNAAFAAVLAAASSARMDVVIPAGTYKLTTGLTWDCEAGSLIGQGLAVLDFTGMTSGYAVSVEGVNGRGSGFNNRSTTHQLSGLQITGPDSDATTVDGFLVQDAPSGSGNLSQVNVENLYVYGFRDQWYFGDNTWCWRFTNCTMGHAHRRIVSMFSGLNAGENYSFYGCTFFSSTNAAFTATAVYGDVGGNSDAYFFGCSFDYNDVELDWNSGVANLVGCHIEDHANNGNPMIKLSYTGGNAHTALTVVGSSISPTETNPGRDHLIETTGSNIAVSFTGVKVNCFGMSTSLVKVLSGTPSYSWSGGDFDTNTGAVVASPGVLANALYNGDWELGSTAGWSNGGTVTYSAQTGTVASGTYALKMAGTGVAAASFIKQTFVCPPNIDIISYADLAADTVTGGSVAFQLQFKAQDLTTISTTAVATISANQSMTRAGTKVRTPAGTAFVSIIFAPTNLNGNVYADNCYLAVMASGGGGALIVFGTGSNQIMQGNDTRVTKLTTVQSKSANYTALSTDMTVLGTGGSGGITITLPAASAGGRLEVVKVDSGAGAVTISAPSGTVKGASTLALSSQWASATCVSDGTNWAVV